MKISRQKILIAENGLKVIRKSNGIYIRRHLSAIVDASTVCIFTGRLSMRGIQLYTELRGSINWEAAAFYFGQDFLVHYPSENMVVVGNEFDI